MEKDFHKLMNNAVYGKTCENQRKRTDIHLITDMSKAAKLIIKPHLRYFRMFHENLMVLELKKVKLLLTNPSYVGFVVLELSKLHMMRYCPFLFTDFSTDKFPCLFRFLISTILSNRSLSLDTSQFNTQAFLPIDSTTMS